MENFVWIRIDRTRREILGDKKRRILKKIQVLHFLKGKTCWKRKVLRNSQLSSLLPLWKNICYSSNLFSFSIHYKDGMQLLKFHFLQMVKEFLCIDFHSTWQNLSLWNFIPFNPDYFLHFLCNSFVRQFKSISFNLFKLTFPPRHFFSLSKSFKRHPTYS